MVQRSNQTVKSYRLDRRPINRAVCNNLRELTLCQAGDAVVIDRLVLVSSRRAIMIFSDLQDNVRQKRATADYFGQTGSPGFRQRACRFGSLEQDICGLRQRNRNLTRPASRPVRP